MLADYGRTIYFGGKITGGNSGTDGKDRGQTGEFHFFQSKKSLTGKKGIHQSDPDFPPHFPIFPGNKSA